MHKITVLYFVKIVEIVVNLTVSNPYLIDLYMIKLIVYVERKYCGEMHCTCTIVRHL